MQPNSGVAGPSMSRSGAFSTIEGVACRRYAKTRSARALPAQARITATNGGPRNGRGNDGGRSTSCRRGGSDGVRHERSTARYCLYSTHWWLGLRARPAPPKRARQRQQRTPPTQSKANFSCGVTPDTYLLNMRNWTPRRHVIRPNAGMKRLLTNLPIHAEIR